MHVPDRRLATVLLLAAVLALGGCFGGKDSRDLRSGVDELYLRGTKAMNSGNFQNAITYFEALTARYPFSNQAKQAQLDLIYCYYRNGNNELAIDAATQFERENPTHPRVDYALYMRGLAKFSGERGFGAKLFRVDLDKRPPIGAMESFSTFSQLVKRYPDSIYAPDARQRMVFLRNRLANHELHVARYYMRRGAYAAALNRAKHVIEAFDGAPAVADALDIMIISYQKLGMQDLASDARAVLRANYPDRPLAQPEKKKKFILF